MTTIHFVRHAHSPWVPNREAERPLSERGHEQAERVADILSNESVDAVVSSPFARARQTVRPIADRNGVELETDDGFRERQLTDGPVESIGETFESAIKRVWSDWSFAWPNGESNRDAKRRGVAAVERLRERHSGESIVVGTHGNLLTLILHEYDERFDAEFWRAELTMPDIYEVTFPAEDEEVEITRRYEDSTVVG
ncbi:histidine phosphatase family protein [Haladaptatus sp. AB618]|uniref:histidine phosphatase family protein n=1 Tax=Haladaptatus sp. AB618 TaxID=2934173 RepID=UPI00209BC083|nr:histidine phosphatase family protein [Haladaptatus sp. AB618]MCO8255163.1 histidine phosphatase family protein [Haladaptatus sp. AB618]